MKITPHFSFAEFQCKDSTPYPAEWIHNRLLVLCALLEVIRKDVGKSLIIVSGYRTATYNRRIGGARRSQHVEGRAADIRCPGMTAKELHAKILGVISTKKHHIGGLALYPQFVHVDIRPAERLVRWTGGRTIV